MEKNPYRGGFDPMFSELLNDYIARLGCSGRELAEASGLSAATVSRYRSGERSPESESERAKIAAGVARLAAERGIALTETAAAADIAACFPAEELDFEHFRANFGALLSAVGLSLSELARGTNYDASYLSRIRSGTRRPAEPERFIAAVAGFVSRRCETGAERAALAELIGAEPDAELRPALAAWLGGSAGARDGGVESFLRKLDEFDLNEYIRSTHFDSLRVPAAPFQLPIARTYYGLEQMRAGELDFLKATVLSRADTPVFLCSDMPMDDMAEDADFKRKYMLGMALMLKKGLHLDVVHNLDRPFGELMLGLEGWIPLYMTGQISPFYLRGVQNNVYCHFLNVSGAAALSGECIARAHARGRYELVKGGEALRYYRSRADAIRRKALPLMDIYRAEHAAALRAFLLADARVPGERRRLLAAPPPAVLREETLRDFLAARSLPEAEQRLISDHAAAQRARLETVLAHSPVADAFPAPAEEDFEVYPPSLPLAALFFDRDLRYTPEEYARHCADAHDFAASHPGYTVRESAASLRNISIAVHAGKWAMVSKSNAPAIHFVVRYPKLRAALEAFVEERA